METCPMPNLSFSMMDEYTEESDAAGCYVNPFVGEGRYATYLRNWLSIVPKRQILLLNFDDWTADATDAMETVSRFLQLPPFRPRHGGPRGARSMNSSYGYNIEEAHNTHDARSVHVQVEGKSAADAVRKDAVENQLAPSTYCILHEFYRPFMEEFDELLEGYGYSPMRWNTSTRGDGLMCPPEDRYWRAKAGARAAARAAADSSHAAGRRLKQAASNYSFLLLLR